MLCSLLVSYSISCSRSGSVRVFFLPTPTGQSFWPISVLVPCHRQHTYDFLLVNYQLWQEWRCKFLPTNRSVILTEFCVVALHLFAHKWLHIQTVWTTKLAIVHVLHGNPLGWEILFICIDRRFHSMDHAYPELVTEHYRNSNGAGDNLGKTKSTFFFRKVHNYDKLVSTYYMWYT